MSDKGKRGLHEGGGGGVGGTAWNTLKGGGTEKRGGQIKIFKKKGGGGGKLDQVVYALKKGVAGTPLKLWPGISVCGAAKKHRV